MVLYAGCILLLASATAYAIYGKTMLRKARRLMNDVETLSRAPQAADPMDQEWAHEFYVRQALGLVPHPTQERTAGPWAPPVGMADALLYTLRSSAPERPSETALALETVRALAGTVDRLSTRLEQRAGEGDATAVVLLCEVARARQPHDEVGMSRQLLAALDAASAYVRTVAAPHRPEPAPDRTPLQVLDEMFAEWGVPTACPGCAGNDDPCPACAMAEPGDREQDTEDTVEVGAPVA